MIQKKALYLSKHPHAISHASEHFSGIYLSLYTHTHKHTLYRWLSDFVSTSRRRKLVEGTLAVMFSHHLIKIKSRCDCVGGPLRLEKLFLS